jgi:hypothetical protein
MVVYADSSFANRRDKSSQLGYVVCLRDKTGTMCILGYRSCKSWRVVRSAIDESLVGVGVLSEACLFILRGRYHLLLLIAIALVLTWRDLGVATGGGLAQCGPYTSYE